jgi:hypothetical protein
MPTPGVPPAWCFEPGGKIDLSVTVDGGSLRVYVLDVDQDITLGGTSELAAWLSAHRPGSLQDPRSSLIDRMKRDRFFRWG